MHASPTTTSLHLGQYFIPAPPPVVTKKYFGLFGEDITYFEDKFQEEASLYLQSCVMLVGAHAATRQRVARMWVDAQLARGANVIWVNSSELQLKESSSTLNFRPLMEAAYSALNYEHHQLLEAMATLGMVGLSSLVNDHLQEILYSRNPTFPTLQAMQNGRGHLINCYVPSEVVMSSGQVSIANLIICLNVLAQASGAILVIDWDVEYPPMSALPGSLTCYSQLGGTASYSDDCWSGGASVSGISRYDDILILRNHVTPTLLDSLGWEGVAADDFSNLPNYLLIHKKNGSSNMRFVVWDTPPEENNSTEPSAT